MRGRGGVIITGFLCFRFGVGGIFGGFINIILRFLCHLPQVTGNRCILVKKVTEVRYSECVTPVVIRRVPVTLSYH